MDSQQKEIIFDNLESMIKRCKYDKEYKIELIDALEQLLIKYKSEPKLDDDKQIRLKQIQDVRYSARASGNQTYLIELLTKNMKSQYQKQNYTECAENCVELANIYISKKDLENAKLFYEKAVDYYKLTDDKFKLTQTRFALTNLLEDIKEKSEQPQYKKIMNGYRPPMQRYFKMTKRTVEEEPDWFS